MSFFLPLLRSLVSTTITRKVWSKKLLSALCRLPAALWCCLCHRLERDSFSSNFSPYAMNLNRNFRQIVDKTLVTRNPPSSPSITRCLSVGVCVHVERTTERNATNERTNYRTNETTPKSQHRKSSSSLATNHN